MTFQQSFFAVALFPGLFVLGFFGGVVALAQREPVPMDPTAREKPIVTPEKEKDVDKKRIREGTTFQGKKVFFRQTGNRTTLYAVDSDERYVCLENLNLERILKAIEEKPTRNVWTIDGLFTEFRGENFVLIQRSVVSPIDFGTKEKPVPGEASSP